MPVPESARLDYPYTRFQMSQRKNAIDFWQVVGRSAPRKDLLRQAIGLPGLQNGLQP